MRESEGSQRDLRSKRAAFIGGARQKGDYDEFQEQLQVVPDGCAGMALRYFRA
jgi:hypothetical protein